MQVALQFHNDVAEISMDDGKRNVITRDAAERILAALDEAENRANAIVLAGRPGAFCAGFHMDTMTGDDTEAREQLTNAGARILVRLFGMGLPLVAACTGHAFTIGALWLLACDTRVGAQGQFKYGLPETAMGLAMPKWTLGPLTTRLAPKAYIPVVVQSKVLDPAGAIDAGFVDTLLPENDVVTAAISVAAELAKLPAKAYATNKLQVRQAELQGMEADLNSGSS